MSEVLHVAFEIGERTWKIGSTVPGGRKRVKTVEARNRHDCLEEIGRAKKRFGLAEDAPVVSCYEAGREGFWVHRWLTSENITSYVVDSSSIEVSRRGRRAKTDRLDAEKLLDMLVRFLRGETRLWSVVNVPDVESEDARVLPREIERLKKERTGHVNRIKGKLALHGIRMKGLSKFDEKLQALRGVDGSPLPPRALGELQRQYERLQLVETHLKELERQQQELAEDRSTAAGRKVERLSSLRGIGVASACPLVLEFFAWRNFNNRGQVGSLAGMVGTPYVSDKGQREQGISKAGNKRVRWRMVQLAWQWLRYQPRSELASWFVENFGSAGKRCRRVGIVALARKLLVALWRFVDQGVVPKGAVLK